MTCPRCRHHVDRAQPSDPTCRGPWIAYPCNHWITRSQAATPLATVAARTAEHRHTDEETP